MSLSNLLLKLRKKSCQLSSTSVYYRFLIFFITILVVLLVLETVFIALTTSAIPAVFDVDSSNSLYPVQLFETEVVYHVQKALSIPVERGEEATCLLYNHGDFFEMDISTACAGVHEIVFLAALMLGTLAATWLISARGRRVKGTLKWFSILASVLFVENLVRLFTIYHLALHLGVDTMWRIHYVFWKYGHLLIILALFVAWFLLAVRKKISIPI